MDSRITATQDREIVSAINRRTGAGLRSSAVLRTGDSGVPFAPSGRMADQPW